MLVHHADVHEQVGRHHVGLEVAALDVELHQCLHAGLQRVIQGPLGKNVCLAEILRQAPRALGQGHQPGSWLLGQTLEQRLDFLPQHARHQPLGPLLADLVEDEQGHSDRQPIAGIAWLVQVLRRAIDPAQADHLGEGLGGDACRLMSHQFCLGEGERCRLTWGQHPAGLAVPALQGLAVADLRGQLLVVKGEDQRFVHQHVLAA